MSNKLGLGGLKKKTAAEFIAEAGINLSRDILLSQLLVAMA